MPRPKLTEYEFAATAIAKTIKKLRKWGRGRDATPEPLMRQVLVDAVAAVCIMTDDPATVEEAISYLRAITDDYQKKHGVVFELPPEFESPLDVEFKNQADGSFTEG
jgi:hypothetical protein